MIVVLSLVSKISTHSPTPLVSSYFKFLPPPPPSFPLCHFEINILQEKRREADWQSDWLRVEFKLISPWSPNCQLWIEWNGTELVQGRDGFPWHWVKWLIGPTGRRDVSIFPQPIAYRIISDHDWLHVQIGAPVREVKYVPFSRMCHRYYEPDRTDTTLIKRGISKYAD